MIHFEVLFLLNGMGSLECVRVLNQELDDTLISSASP